MGHTPHPNPSPRLQIVLPAQASAVPCEHVFSSGKETDTDQRSNLSPETMERLQILEHLFWNDWLSFVDGLVVNEDELHSL
ncbi:hypothetical protein PAXRUDRAFT_173918 [Paxillus rubicundulus Ve08.2h10]|uniref:HAT C-terminal dimerisation domain-containing protein n=1 Tax=Paxillus rubicundulus Ve08.2h10 TaxID=930991 RepID=A0A0D0CIQ3_9AGAM|nr:hypothetical protein PAXRUDRAFT_173918 [Paxillus rubicundulus Ve08.2h10]